MKNFSLLMIAAGSLLLVPPAGAQERAAVAKLAVLDLGDKGVGADLVSLMSASVARQLSSYGVFEVITRADVGKLLTHVQDRISAGCASPDCLVQVSDALGADKLVGGEVGLVGKRYLISLQRIDARKAVVEHRVQREFEGPLETIREEVRLATHQLVEDILKLESGKLLLQVSEEGADVSLDGAVVGTSPLKGLSLPAGPHELRVVKQGFVAWARTLQVRPRSTEAVEARLIPSAEFIQAYEDRADSMRRWAWVSLATFAALEAAALGLRLYTWQKFDPIEAEYKDLVDPGERSQYYQDHVDQMNLAEKLDYAALGSALVGAVIGGVSLYLFLEGEDPDRYELYREVSAVPEVSVSPAPGGASLSLGWAF